MGHPILITSLLVALLNGCVERTDPAMRNAKVTRYPNGNLHTFQEFIQDTIQDGTYVRYYEDVTAVEIEIHYSNNRKHGVQTAYYRNGQLKSLASYENGLEEGDACWYHENGALSSWVKYSHGWKQSPSLTYYDTREPKAEIAYGDSNKVVYRIDYAKDGAVVKEGGQRPRHWDELVAQARVLALAADTIGP
jgi:antitoxin component YwqK of YwqJK toxin-antitoxin module